MDDQMSTVVDTLPIIIPKLLVGRPEKNTNWTSASLESPRRGQNESSTSPRVLGRQKEYVKNVDKMKIGKVNISV